MICFVLILEESAFRVATRLSLEDEEWREGDAWEATAEASDLYVKAIRIIQGITIVRHTVVRAVSTF